MSKEYKIHNDGYGYLSAEFPAEYPNTHIESDMTDTMLKKKIEAILKTLTLEEKIDMLSADGIMGQDTSAMSIDKSYGTGYWKGAARVGVPVMRCYDGPMGVIGNSGFETTRPSSEISLACTFDRDLAERYGALYARDNKASAGNMQLGIQTDLVRTLTTSRARDMFGEDWYLEGQIGSAMAKGLEDNNVLACLKHVGGMGNIDEQTMMENQLSIYEQIFRNDNSAHTVMTNYGSTNGQQACADSYVLKEVFRNQWNWKGIVLTDWGGNYQFTTDKGVTMETPSDGFNNLEAVRKALEAGTLTEADIDEAVGYNLYAMGRIGYLGLVQISRDGTAAADPNPPESIEMDEVMDEGRRNEILDENSREAEEIAQAGMVLLKNEGSVLPLSRDTSAVLLGPGAIHTVAGHMHECSFGRLKDLAVSPSDALEKQLDHVASYIVYDDLGTPVPADCLFADAALSAGGVHRTGTDGDGNAVDCVDPQINFVTNSVTYRNGPDGSAFPYGKNGAAFTLTTWLRAPETGEYLLKAEAMAAAELEAYIEIDGEKKEIGSAGGRIGNGFFGTTGPVTTKTGLDIPMGPQEFHMPFGPVDPEDDNDGEGFAPPPVMPPFMMKEPGAVSFHLEAGEVYPITITVSGHIPEAYDYQIGKKDLQVRLAWVTPSQKEKNYSDAISAAGQSGSTVVLFAHEIDSLSLEERQQVMLTEAIRSAKQAGNKVVLVLSTALPVDIMPWEKDCDAILAAWLPGQTGGQSIANVLTGAYNPSGKLSVTWPKDFEADQRELNPNGRKVLQRASHPSSNIPTEIREGLFSGYRWYDATGRADQVLYPFGYGLSYTGFTQSVTEVSPAAGPGENAGLDVTVTVRNTGTAAGADVVQLYIEAPADGMVPGAVYDPMKVAESFRYVDENGEVTGDMRQALYFPAIDGIQFAAKQLCGFAKTAELQPGEETEVTIHVSQRSLSYWDASRKEYIVRKDGTKDKWVTVYGTRTFRLGTGAAFSAEIALQDRAGMRVEAPEQVSAGSQFVMTVTADADTIGVQLLNALGETLPVFDLNISRTETVSRWEFRTVVNIPGRTTIQAARKTWSGWEKPSAKASVLVLQSEPEILTFSPENEVARSGQAITFIAVVNTANAEIELADEKDAPIPATVVGKDLRPDGNVEVRLEAVCSTPEIGWIVTAKAGSSRARTAVSVL